MTNISKTIYNEFRKITARDIIFGLAMMNVSFFLTYVTTFGFMMNIGVRGDAIEMASSRIEERVSILNQSYFDNTKELTLDYALSKGFRENAHVQYISFDVPAAYNNVASVQK
jgi:hypothetical protein